MFLVTTADQRTWNSNEKILFLGEWCKRYSQKKTWSRLDHEVVPYHWDDRHRLYQDYGYLQEVYERYLKEFSLQLNTIHNVQFGLRYWRILIGPWLNFFVSILYDRFKSIQAAVQYRSITSTRIIEYPENKIVPKNMIHFARLFKSDEYNHHLYSKIILFLKNIPYQTLPFDYDKIGENRSIPSSIPIRDASWKVLMKCMLKLYNKLTLPLPKNYVFVASDLGYRREMLLQCFLGQIPVVKFLNFDIPDTDFNPNMRQEISFNIKHNDFEDCLEYLLPQQIPSAYLEGFQMLRSGALEKYQVQKPKVIISTVGLIVNDEFKCWAAGKSEEGTTLVAGQHGGIYGMSLWHAMEEHEVRISDTYLSWGWAEKANPKVTPVPANKLLAKVHALKPRKSGKILWVSIGIPRYSYFMYSAPIASQILDYLSIQQQFLKTVCPAVHDLLLLRLDPNYHDWDLLERWRDFDPLLNVYKGSCTLDTQLNESRLFIGTYNGTTYLETFVANFPTVIFWDSKHYELRPSAKPYFDKLREAGIFHDEPESAAAIVNEIFQDPWLWWKQSRVQKAKDEFCRKFAWTTQDWVMRWRKTLVECRGLNSI